MDNASRKAGHSVTILDVARESGVSYSTVSRVLNGLDYVKESTRLRVLAAAERLGYVANIQARSLAGGRTQIIGLLVPGLNNGYVTEIIGGADQELARSGFDMMLYTTHRFEGKESLYVRTIASGLVDGLILIVPYNAERYLTGLPASDFPRVLVHQADPTHSSTTVDTTNWQGAYDATNHLIGLGHRRIALIGGSSRLNSARERLDGYRAALDQAAIPFDDALVVPGEYIPDGGRAAMTALLRITPRPTAVFACNDLSAFGALDALREAGLRVPDDMSLVGFDDIPLASLVFPRLTTVRQPLHQIGQVAVRLLLDKLNDPDQPPRTVTLATELIIRDSTAPPAT